MGYRFSHAALGDLRDIVDYIFEQGHPGSAHSVVNEIKRVCGLIGDMPGIGHSVEFITEETFFVFPAGKYPAYLIFYTLDETETVVISRILHDRRNIEALFM